MLLRVFRTVVLLLWLNNALLAADPSGVWLDVPFVKQEGQSRAPNAEAERIQRALYSDTAQGIYAAGMEAYFQRNGYRVFAFGGDWQDLEQHLKKGRPLIVALRPGSTRPLHYVVVAGLDQRRQLVLLNDPAERKLVKEERSRFEQTWNAASAWTLLALPETDSH